MNPHVITDLASCRTHEIRSQVADCRRSSQVAQARAYARTASAEGSGRRSRLRSRLGFTLVEAGLRLVASAPSARPQRQS
jgi:hypothetical protein